MTTTSNPAPNLTANYQHLLDQLAGLPAREVLAIVTGRPLAEEHDEETNQDECVYCGGSNPDGYCDASPDGAHHMEQGG
jgi:hypothetical protein